MFSCPSFDPTKDLPPGSLSSKTILVTGGNAGLGFASCTAFVRAGARVYLCARSESKAADAIKKTTALIPSADIRYLPLDLSSFSSIRSCAATFLSREDKLDVLLNNAGVMAMPPTLTTEGYEVQFGTNFMGHFLLTQLLLPALRSAQGRVVNVASLGHTMAWRGVPLNGDLTAFLTRTNMWERYGVSKLANILHAAELSRREPDVEAVSVHPGVVFGGLYDTLATGWWGYWAFVSVVKRVWWHNEEWVSRNQICMASRKLVEGENGAYFVPVGTKGTAWHPLGASRFARNEELAGRLWEWAEAEVRRHEERE